MKTINDYAELVKAKHALNKSIAPVEDGANIAGSYTSGEQFIRDGVLYTALTTIATNTAWSSLTLDTDYKLADDITSQLASLNQTLTNNLANEVVTRAKLGGHNILNFKDNTYNNGGSITLVKGTQRTLAVNIDSIPAGTYNVVFDVDTFSVSSGGGGIRFLDANNQSVGGYNVDSTGKKATTLTLTGIATQMYCVIPSDEPNSDATLKMSHFMVCLPTDSNTDYQPYSMTNQELTPIAQAVSNRNLLDNPWFTVNQRGFVSTNTAGYTVDRWQLSWNPGNITVSLGNDGITLDATNATGLGYFAQFIDNLDIAGKVVTASVLLADGTIKTGTGVMPTKGSTGPYIITGEFNLYLQYNSNNDTPRLYISIEEGHSVTIKAIKLELGSISTLAQDTAPNYAEELLKCQRYFVRIGGTERIYLGTAISLDNDKATIAIKLPTDMRTLSRIDGITNLEVSKESAIPITALDSSYLNNGYLTLIVSSSGTVSGSSYFARVKPNSNIDFVADL